jgi:proteasome assembly chaperone (PAC2) family protein
MNIRKKINGNGIWIWRGAVAFLISTIMGIMGFFGTHIFYKLDTLSDVYAKNKEVKEMSKKIEKMEHIYAKKSEVKELSKKMDEGFQRINDKIEATSNRTNNKMDEMNRYLRDNH